MHMCMCMHTCMCMCMASIVSSRVARLWRTPREYFFASCSARLPEK